MRILDAIAPTALTEAAFFDTFPASDATVFEGIWNAYPYFPSGTVVAGGINEGLFVLRPTSITVSGATPTPAVPARGALAVVGANPTAGRTSLRLDVPESGTVRVSVTDARGREVAVLFDGPVGAGETPLAFDGSALAAGVYTVHAALPGGTTVRASVVVAR